MMQENVEPHSDIVCDLGEGPLWCAKSGKIYWHDVPGRKLHCADASGDHSESWNTGKMPGCFAFRKQGGLVAAFRNQLAVYDPYEREITEISGHSIDFAVERFNDGACDAKGRFWVGSFEPSLQKAAGCLYRIDPDFSAHKMDQGIAMSNGLAWSPDADVLYFADSRPGMVYSYAFDAEAGQIGERHVFLDYQDRPGRPDGCTVDSEGCLWVAEVTAGRVSRYDPKGRKVVSIELPVSKPTSVIFGGSDYRTLFITTMRYGLTEAELAREPLAGRLLKVSMETPGLPENAFSG